MSDIVEKLREAVATLRELNATVFDEQRGESLYASAADEITRLRAEYAEDCGRLLQTIKYLTGIAAKGEGREPAEDETVEQFVLGYVKRVEAELAAIKGQEPVALIDGNGEQVLFPSDVMYHYWIGRNCIPLYALPVADKDAERFRFRLDYIRQNINDNTAIRFALDARDEEIDAMAKGE